MAVTALPPTARKPREPGAFVVLGRCGSVDGPACGAIPVGLATKGLHTIDQPSGACSVERFGGCFPGGWESLGGRRTDAAASQIRSTCLPGRLDRSPHWASACGLAAIRRCEPGGRKPDQPVIKVTANTAHGALNRCFGRGEPRHGSGDPASSVGTQRHGRRANVPSTLRSAGAAQPWGAGRSTPTCVFPQAGRGDHRARPAPLGGGPCRSRIAMVKGMLMMSRPCSRASG